MRIRYCKILQNVRMDTEEDSWLTPLDDLSSFTKKNDQYAKTSMKQITHFLKAFRNALKPTTKPSSDWLIVESERPVRFTSKMKSYFRKLHLSKNNTDTDSLALQEWLDTLVTWMMDNEETVSVSVFCWLHCRQRRCWHCITQQRAGKHSCIFQTLPCNRCYICVNALLSLNHWSKDA